MEDEAYLFVGDKEDPDYGHTIAVPMDEFKANAKVWKERGIRPATGKELEPVQRGMEKQIAADSPGTAALVGGLRGATFGLSDVALSEMGPEGSGQALNTLKEANPVISGASELAGSLATLKPLGGLSSGIKGAAVSGAVGGAGMELAEQARDQQGYDAGDIAISGGVGAGLGAGLAAAPAVGSRVAQAGLRGVQKATNVGKGVATRIVDAADSNPVVRDILGSVTGGTSNAVTGAARMVAKAPDVSQKGIEALKFREAVSKLTTNMLQNNKQMGKKEASTLARLLLKKEIQTGSVITDAGPMFSTEAATRYSSTLQQSRKAAADGVDEEIRMLLDKMK